MSEIILYSQLIIPGLTLALIMLWILPKEQIQLRIFILIFSFVLMRDSLIPSGLWKITNSFEIRFTGKPTSNLIIAFCSFFLATYSGRLIGIGKISLWKNYFWSGIIFGFFCSFLVVAPFYLIIKLGILHLTLPAIVDFFPVLIILLISLSGNFLEEILFRGHFHEYLENPDYLKTESL